MTSRRYHYPASDADAVWRQDVMRRLGVLERTVQQPVGIVDSGLAVTDITTAAFQTLVTVDVEVPEWANVVDVIAFGGVSHIFSADQLLQLQLRIGGAGQSAFSHTVTNGDPDVKHQSDTHTVEDPGGSVTLELLGRVNTSTESSSVAFLNAYLVARL